MKSRFLYIPLVAASILFVLQCSDSNPLRSTISSSQKADWCFQNPLPTSNDLFGVQFINESVVYAVGSGATLLFSSDKGNSWKIESHFPATATGLFFLDARKGWAVGESGMILHTENGGITWHEQQSGVSSYLIGIHFVDELLGWAVGNGGIILRTFDGGRNWISTLIPGVKSLRDVAFLNASDGWAVGSAYSETGEAILKTSDGGKTWEFVDAGVPSDLGDPDPYFWDEVFTDLSAIAVNAENEITIVGEAYQGGLIGGIIIASNDRGDTWNVELTDVPHNDVLYLDGGRSWIVGYGGTIFQSESSKESWNLVIGTGYDLRSISFADNLNGCAVGYAGSIHITSDGGLTWKKITQGTRTFLEDIQFTDSLHGWTAGFNGVMRTVDGGNNWEQTTGTATSAVFFLDSKNGWSCDHSGSMDRTYDGGVSWSRLYTGTVEGTVWDIYFMDSLNGLTCGSFYIMRTEDGGKTWKDVWWTGRPYVNLLGISFTDSLNGWIAGENSTMLRTRDGGWTWERQSAPGTGSRDVYFIDTLKGWAVGPSTHMLYTIDGGAKWQYSGVPGPLFGLNSVHFSDERHGWAVGTEGKIVATSDGGKSWHFQDSPVEATFLSNLEAVWAVDSNKVWAAGYKGAILHFNNSSR